MLPRHNGEMEWELESELEGEFESEFESEEEGEEFLGTIARGIGGLLGESEFEEEYEGEEEGEFEGQEFFRRIGRLVRRAAPVLRRVARVAAPIVGTAVGGPLGGALGRVAASALGEGEFEEEYEEEYEGEYEEEYEGEGEWEGEFEEEDVLGQPWLIEPIAAQYPDVNFIIPHLGSFADDWRVHTQVVDQLARLPNVYADVSGVKRFDYVIEAVRRGGARKVLFGSDGPWLHPALELQKIRLLRLPPDDEALVLGRNLLRLINKATSSSTDPNNIETARDYTAQ